MVRFTEGVACGLLGTLCVGAAVLAGSGLLGIAAALSFILSANCFRQSFTE